MTETQQKGPPAAEIRKLVERTSKATGARSRSCTDPLDRIYSYLHMTVGNRHDAEDLRLRPSCGCSSRSASSLPDGPFSAWLFRIAHNLSMDHFRANRRWQPEEDVPEPPGSAERSAEDEAFQSIGRQSMLELIDRSRRSSSRC